jgi:site-specific DNA-adenine methylase
MFGIFGYPGGKSRVRRRIVHLFRDLYDDCQYREPFCGACYVGLEAMLDPKNSKMHRFWFNDVDIGIF